MAQSKTPRRTAAIVLVFAFLAVATSLTRLHSRPAFLAGFVGGALVIFGIYLLAKR